MAKFTPFAAGLTRPKVGFWFIDKSPKTVDIVLLVFCQNEISHIYRLQNPNVLWMNLLVPKILK